MRIAYISYEYPPDSCDGGIGTYVYQAARMMERRGHEVEVFASSPVRSGRSEDENILVHWIPETNHCDFGVLAGHVFAARHSEKPFDVLEGPEYFADARKAVELVPGIPLVVKMHTPSELAHKLNAPSDRFLQCLGTVRHSLHVLAVDIVRRRPFSKFEVCPPHLQPSHELEKVEREHAKAACIVAPPCKDLCEYAVNSWKIPESAIRLAPHPYSPSQEYLNLQPQSDRFTVGFVGRLEKRKGIETLASAIPAVLDAVPQARFRFIGTANLHSSGLRYDEWLRKRLPRFSARLEFAGKYPLEKMAEAYGSVDVCAFPSLWENFPNVCLEAMSAARAIVASSAGGMADMLDRGRAGKLVAPKNPQALARELVFLLKNPGERMRLGELARSRVLHAYNESIIGEMMERIYQEAVQRSQAPNK